MQKDAMLIQLGYLPNESLLKQLQEIENNTSGYEKIQKHIMDLYDNLRVDGSFIALSNSKSYFKIKIEALNPIQIQEAHEKVKHFSNKFKVKVQKLDNKETYYILGFEN